MNCRTLRRKAAGSCATNMRWDTLQAITFTTRGGESSRSSCAHPRDSHPSLLIQRPDTTRRHTEAGKSFRRTGLTTACFLFAMLFAASGSFAQIPVATPPPPPPPGQESGTSPSGGRIRVDVNLVVLHTTVIDNSGSMRDKRPRVNEAALTLVQNSNPQDEAFVVNFNDDFYLDLDKDFSSSIPELKEALERIDSRGSTAMRDAILGSLDHLKKASKDKKVLLVVTDGEDNASRNSLEKMIREVQKTDTVIYTIGLLSQENKKEAKRARKALEQIAAASGGLAYF